MACVLNPAFWVYIIVLIAAVMIVHLAIPALIEFFGLSGFIGQIIMIILWAVIAILGVYFLFELLSCLFSAGSGLPTFPRGR